MKRACFLFVVFIVTSSWSAAQSHLSDSLDAYARKSLASNKPGAAILVLRNGKTLLRKGYGIGKLPSTAIAPDNVFRIGSITKQFTSTAILKLASEGKILLEESVTTYLPEYNVQGNTVTVEQLLNHTSGIKSYTSIPEVMSKEGKAKAVTVEDFTKVFSEKPFDFTPGTSMLYNNSGYFLLGAIIEKVSGMTYGDYLAKNFFKPLGMKATYTDDSNIPKLVTGFVEAVKDSFVVADYVHPSLPFSAGMIYSTVDDLAKWNAAIFSGKVINQSLLDRAWTPTQTADGIVHSYGYGWSLGRLDDKKTIGHSGGIDGFVSFEMYVPEEKLYVCVLSNNMSAPTGEVAYQLAARALGQHASKPAAIALDPSQLDEYVGVYDINAAESRVIRREGDKLSSQRTGGAKFWIYPYSKDMFAFTDSDSKIRFTRNAKNEIVGMEVTGRDWVPGKATKTNKPLPSERTAIAIDPVQFDPYVGEYELAPGFIIRIWREEHAFKAQATGQPAFDIYPESESRYFLKVVDAVIEFRRDDAGTVTSLVLFQSGREMPGKKIK